MTSLIRSYFVDTTIEDPSGAEYRGEIFGELCPFSDVLLYWRIVVIQEPCSRPCVPCVPFNQNIDPYPLKGGTRSCPLPLALLMGARRVRGGC